MADLHPIVLIDDDEDDRYIFQEGFKHAGCKNDFIEFENGGKFLDYLATAAGKKLPSLIILDLNMPVMDGKEVLRKVKSNPLWTHIPVIVFTTSKMKADREVIYELGANCFISKPGIYNELMEITKSMALLWCLK
ncbi:MAG: response regulator [Flavitalea sp.]